MATQKKLPVAEDIMVTRLVTLRAETDVFKAIETLVKNKISGAPVVDGDNKLLGVFSEKNCMQILIDAAYEGLPTNQVGAFMDNEPQTVSRNTGLLVLAQVFLLSPRRRLPVVEDGNILVGQVSRRDVIAAASKLVAKVPAKENPLLYLSALHDMDNTPVVRR